MKILIINHHPCDVIGGSQIQCDLIATSLTQFGQQVVYFAVDGKQPHYAVNYPVAPHSLRFGELRQVLAQHRPDLVYWRFNRRKLLTALLACKLEQVKFVFAISSLTDLAKWAHRIDFQALSWRDRLRRGVSPAFLRHLLTMRMQYCGYYFVDSVVAQLEQQAGKLPARRQIVIPNSVNMAQTPFAWDKPFVLWIGTLKPVKNPHIYVELARQCQPTGVDFLMAGKVTADAHQYLQRHGCPANLHVLGERPYPEVNGMLQQALFLVQTSYIEGFPNVLIQAWMQGKPTICLAYDPDGLVQAHQLGAVAGNFEQLISATTALLDNPDEREAIGQRAKEFAEAQFTPDKNIKALERFLQSVCTSSSQ